MNDSTGSPAGGAVDAPRNDEVTPHFAYTDLREWIEQARALGEIREVKGANWEEEIGMAAEVVLHDENAPCVIFDEVPGYPKGFRVLTNFFGGRRKNMTLGFHAGLTKLELTDAFRENFVTDLKQVPFKEVTKGPILENVITGDDIDVTMFPTPKWHEHDGGRYIGTACAVITRDPDTGRVNMGTYRVQAFEGNLAASYISNGKQGRIHRDRYFAMGKPCPMVIVIGIDPVSFMAARYTLPDNVPELDWAGALTGGPLDVIEGELTGLPFPAGSEIVLEGEALPDETVKEGPFGEWTGYYAGGEREEPAIRIHRVCYRDDPILTCAASQKPPHSHLFERCFLRSAALMDSLEGAGIPDVTGVWVHQAGAGRTFVAVAIKQRYFGHARQAGLVASQVNPIGYCGRYIVVVDDDIDPTDIHDVIWAMGTRSDPATDLQVLEKTWSSRLDPMAESSERAYNSRVVIDACIPFERRESFPKVAQTSRKLAAEVRAKFPGVFD